MIMLCTSLCSWWYCIRTHAIKFWRWTRLEHGEGTLKYRLHENHVFLNSPHTSVREKRIG